MLIFILYLILIGFFNAIMDVLKDAFDISIFKNWNKKFWNPNISFRNKWKYDQNGLKVGEKFKGSSTVFVMFTDGWHIAKFFMWVFVILSMISYQPIFDNVILNGVCIYTIITVTFESCYRLFKNKNLFSGK